MSDRYLHHQTGYLRNLIVQAVDEIFEAPGTSTWQRTYVRQVSPLKVRIATWVIDFTYDPESWNDWGVMLLRAFPAAIAMSILVSSPLSRPFHPSVLPHNVQLEEHMTHIDIGRFGAPLLVNGGMVDGMPLYPINTGVRQRFGAITVRTVRASRNSHEITKFIVF
jgi:hypothetical protein